MKMDLKRKTYDEILYDMSEKAKALFGSDVNVSGHSVLGIIIRIVAWFYLYLMN